MEIKFSGTVNLSGLDTTLSTQLAAMVAALSSIEAEITHSGTGSNGQATPGSNGNNGPTTNPCTVLDQEIAVTDLTSGVTRRIAHHRSTGNYSNAPQSNYWAQPNVTFSTDGARILFNSDWGCGDPSKPVLDPDAAVDTYVVEFSTPAA